MQFYKGKRGLAVETIEGDFSDTISDRSVFSMVLSDITDANPTG